VISKSEKANDNVGKAIAEIWILDPAYYLVVVA
jgi:hypothetical protein